MFDEGRALGRDGRFAEACPKLEESERLDPGVGTAFNLADCYEHIGRTASAWSLFGEVADTAKQAGQSDRERIARGRAIALEPKLGRLLLRAAAGRDGDDRRAAGGERRARFGDAGRPGAHTVEGAAPGKKAWNMTVRCSRPTP